MDEVLLDQLRHQAQPFLYVAFVGQGVQSQTTRLVDDWARLGITNGFFVCLDDRSYQWLDTNAPHLAKVLSPYSVTPQTLKGLWSWKTALALDLLQAHIPLVMVDVDTHWTLNPTALLAAWLQEYDVLMSQGRDYPTAVFRRHGFTVCAGLLGLAATDRALRFVQEWHTATAAADDDDVALNKVVLESNATVFRFPSRLRGAALKTAVVVTPGTFRNQIRLGVLPWVLFPRAAPTATSQLPYVAHYHELKWR